MQSDWLPVGNCGNGSIRTKKSLESEGPISIETHRMSLRLMGKSMPLTTSSRIRYMLNRRPRSTSGWLSATITACRSGQEWQDLQGRNPDHKLIQFDSSPWRVRTAGTRPRAEVKDQYATAPNANPNLAVANDRFEDGPDAWPHRHGGELSGQGDVDQTSAFVASGPRRACFCSIHDPRDHRSVCRRRDKLCQ